MVQPGLLDTHHFHLTFHVGGQRSMVGLRESKSQLKLYTKIFVSMHVHFPERGSSAYQRLGV